MKYFCATCQRKYDIGEIAADLYEIAAEVIGENLSDLQPSIAGSNTDDCYNLLYRLRRFCNNDAEHASRYFTISGNSIEDYLINARTTDKTLRGNLVLDLEWLIDAYERSGAREAYDAEEEAESPDPKSLFSSQLNKPLYNNEIVFHFGEVGKNRERVLDHYTDKSNNPFAANDGTMRGYRRVCPHCGKRIPRAVGRAPEIVIALSGSPRAGKTSCLTAITSALSNGKYERYGLSMDSFVYDEQWDKLKEEIKFFDSGYAVTKTSQDQSEAPTSSILVRIGNTRRVLTFVDMPGEFFQTGKGFSKEFFTQYSGIYLNIDCIWFFVSKLKAYDYDLGRNGIQTEKQKLLTLTTSEQLAIFEQDSADNFNANLMSLREQIAANGKEMPPAVMILTKTEADVGDHDNQEKYNLFPIDQNVNSKNAAEIKKVLVPDNQGNYQLNENSFYASALKVRQFFTRFSPTMASAFERHCPFRFYAASASYGHYAIRQDGMLPDTIPAIPDERPLLEPTPYHEVYPLLWTLAISSALKVIHYCSWAEKKFLGGFKPPVEGSLSVLFNAEHYIYADQPAASLADDAVMLEDDVGANLLMSEDSMHKMAYKQTDFKHKKV